MRIEKNKLLSMFAISCLGFIVYFNSLDGAFLWDDFHLVTNNTHIRSWSNIVKIFTESIGSGAGRTYHMYRPIQSLSYMFDYTFWKDNVVGYHLGNVFWHIVVALCIYWLINLLYKNNFLSFVTSLLFVAHPMHTESVSYIAGRADMLAVAFTLLSIIFYVKSIDTSQGRFFILSFLCYAVSILSKEHSVFLLALILFYHYVFKKSLNFKKLSLFFVFIGIYIILRVTLLNFLLKDIINETTVFDRLPGFFVSITNYIRLLFLPFNLHMEYGEKLFLWSDPKAIIGVIIAICSMVIAFLKREQHGIILFSVGWFFINLLPYSNIYAINAYMAEHWVYLPSLGFFLLLAKLMQYLYEAKKQRIAAMIIIVTLLIFYSVLTIKQNSYWRDPFKFYSRLVEFVKDSEVAYNNLGVIYAQRGEYALAIPQFKKSLEIRFAYDDPHFNLGKSYSSIGEYYKAIEAYNRGLEFSKNAVGAVTYHSIGYTYSQIGNTQKALEYLKKSVEADPNYAEGYIALAITYYNNEEYNLAKTYYKKAKELGGMKPELEQALRGL